MTARSEGSDFNKKFTIVADLGRGGFGSVLKAQKREDSINYAIKLTAVTNGQMIKELAEFAKLPRNNYVVSYNKFWEDGIPEQEMSFLKNICGVNFNAFLDTRGMLPATFLFVQMELCGRSLRKSLQVQNEYRRPIDMLKCMDLFGQMLNGLRFIHDGGIIHRNLKPENILFAYNSEKHIKISDVGLASRNPAMALVIAPREGHLSVFLYNSPEQLTNSYDKRTDIYTMGLILYELIYPAVQDNVDHCINSIRRTRKVPTEFAPYPEIEKLILIMLDSYPNRRPSIADLVNYVSSGWRTPISVKPKVHTNVVCGNCGTKDITGIRYKCKVCPDFDLCEGCRAKPEPHVRNHALLAIREPYHVLDLSMKNEGSSSQAMSSAEKSTTSPTKRNRGAIHQNPQSSPKRSGSSSQAMSSAEKSNTSPSKRNLRATHQNPQSSPKRSGSSSQAMSSAEKSTTSPSKRNLRAIHQNPQSSPKRSGSSSQAMSSAEKSNTSPTKQATLSPTKKNRGAIKKKPQSSPKRSGSSSQAMSSAEKSTTSSTKQDTLSPTNGNRGAIHRNPQSGPMRLGSLSLVDQSTMIPTIQATTSSTMPNVSSLTSGKRGGIYPSPKMGPMNPGASRLVGQSTMGPMQQAAVRPNLQANKNEMRPAIMSPPSDNRNIIRQKRVSQKGQGTSSRAGQNETSPTSKARARAKSPRKRAECECLAKGRLRWKVSKSAQSAASWLKPSVAGPENSWSVDNTPSLANQSTVNPSQANRSTANPSQANRSTANPSQANRSTANPSQANQSIVNPSGSNVVNMTLHPGIVCSNCRMQPLTGLRHTCIKCIDFNYCDACLKKNESHASVHEFIPLERFFMHDVICCCCKHVTILGIRYFCKKCSVNYCSMCYPNAEQCKEHSFHFYV